MKKTIALLLVAMLLGIGLIVSCSDDAEPEPTPTPTPTTPVEKYKVTFDSDGRAFTDGTTAAKVVEVEKDGTVGSKWPEIDEEKIGTDILQGWFDGTTQVTRSTKITKDVTFKAKYEAALFTFDNSVNSATNTNFVITTSQGGKHGAWDEANTEDGDNKFTIKTGGIQYRYPVTYNFDYKDYDFVDVEYTASSVNNLVLKQYDSDGGYDAFSGSIPNTAESATGVITWEVRKAVPADPTKPELPVGFAIQKWTAGAANTTIQITKITFRKGTRYKIKFDTDGGTPVPADSYLVDGTKVGSYLPSNVTKAGFIFGGWVNGSTPVGSDTTVTSSFNNATLKPLWLPEVSGLASMTITFVGDLSEFKNYTASGNPDAVLAALDGEDKTKGFSVGGLNYEWRLWSFKVTLPNGATLAHYDKITFDFDQTQGNGTNYKNVYVAAAPSKGDNAFKDPTSSSYIGSKAVTNTVATAALTSLTLTITKPLAAGLTGEIDVCIYIPAGDNNGPYGIKNIVFVKE